MARIDLKFKNVVEIINIILLFANEGMGSGPNFCSA